MQVHGSISFWGRLRSPFFDPGQIFPCCRIPPSGRFGRGNALGGLNLGFPSSEGDRPCRRPWSAPLVPERDIPGSPMALPPLISILTTSPLGVLHHDLENGLLYPAGGDLLEVLSDSTGRLFDEKAESVVTMWAPSGAGRRRTSMEWFCQRRGPAKLLRRSLTRTPRRGCGGDDFRRTCWKVGSKRRYGRMTGVVVFGGLRRAAFRLGKDVVRGFSWNTILLALRAMHGVL